MKILIMVLVFASGAVCLSGQEQQSRYLPSARMHEQVFIGAGGSFPQVGNPSPTFAAGGALIVSLGSRFFIRPAAAFSQNFPKAGKTTRQIQGLVFVGFKTTPYLVVVVGRGETFLFTAGKFHAALPITVVSSAWTPWSKKPGWEKGIGVFTPVNHTAIRGWGAGLQVGYTW